MVIKAVVLASYPEGFPTNDNFRVEEREDPKLTNDGEVLVKLRYISVDPYMRGRMRANLQSYFVGPFQLGEPLTGGCVAEVVDSKNSSFQKGDIVQGFLPWQTLALVSAEEAKQLVKVHHLEGISISTAIGVLGMPGMTAYFGLLDITHPKEGETVVVSGAAGAVGSLVGQIAKIKGCRVIGIAGSDEKSQLLKERYGFDEVLNYKTFDNLEKLRAALKIAAPKGVDIYFDNTGGYISDAVTLELNNFARVSVCGAISTYNEKELMSAQGPRTDFILVIKQVKKEGFLVFRWASRYPEGIQQMAQWIKEGKLKFDETVVKGIEHCGQAFIDMLSGKNIGKMVVEV